MAPVNLVLGCEKDRRCGTRFFFPKANFQVRLPFCVCSAMCPFTSVCIFTSVSTFTAVHIYYIYVCVHIYISVYIYYIYISVHIKNGKHYQLCYCWNTEFGCPHGWGIENDPTHSSSPKNICTTTIKKEHKKKLF